MEHQRIAIRVREERHMTDAGVECLAKELDAASAECITGRRNVFDVQRQRIRVRVVAERKVVGHDDAERYRACLELREVALRHVHGARQPECRPVERDSCVEIIRRDGDEVDTSDDRLGERIHDPMLSRAGQHGALR